MPCLVDESDLQQILEEFLKAAVIADPSLSNPALRDFLSVPENPKTRDDNARPRLTIPVAQAEPNFACVQTPLHLEPVSREEREAVVVTPTSASLTPKTIKDLTLKALHRSDSMRSTPERGDLVNLGMQVVTEFRGRPAVVTEVFEKHCSVTVLDQSMKFGEGELWPNFGDLEITCDSWRLGTHVTISGLCNNRHQMLNGLGGIIIEHPSEGHPCFVQKPSLPFKPRLTLCVALDDPATARQKSVLLEPQFLIPTDSPDMKLRVARLHYTKMLSQSLQDLAEKGMGG